MNLDRRKKNTVLMKSLRLEVKMILVRIVDHVANKFSGSSELHRAKSESGIGTECLMEYSPA